MPARCPEVSFVLISVSRECRSPCFLVDTMRKSLTPRLGRGREGWQTASLRRLGRFRHGHPLQHPCRYMHYIIICCICMLYLRSREGDPRPPGVWAVVSPGGRRLLPPGVAACYPPGYEPVSPGGMGVVPLGVSGSYPPGYQARTPGGASLPSPRG